MEEEHVISTFGETTLMLICNYQPMLLNNWKNYFPGLLGQLGSIDNDGQCALMRLFQSDRMKEIDFDQ